MAVQFNSNQYIVVKAKDPLATKRIDGAYFIGPRVQDHGALANKEYWIFNQKGEVGRCNATQQSIRNCIISLDEVEVISSEEAEKRIGRIAIDAMHKAYAKFFA